MEPPNLPVKFSPGFPPDLAHSPEEFIEGLPYLMVSMLERRYLSALQLQDWVVGGGESGPHRPLLREIVRLGKGTAVDDGQGAMPHLLTACHSPGHSLVMAVHGEGDRHRIYMGGRRCNDSSPTATPDYLEHLQFALKAYFSGLEMSADAKRLDGRDMPGLANLLQTAPALGVMTGIPSGRTRQPLGDFQSIDRLVDSLGRHKYALMTVAEPLEPWIIDQTLDLCRRLKSEVHAWTEMTISRTRQKTDSETSQEAAPEGATIAGHLPAVLFTLAGFMQVAGFGLGSAMRSLGYAAASIGSRKPPPNAKQISRATGTSDSATVQILNANAEACERLLDQYILRLTAGRSTGWWQTALYIAAESEAGLHAVAAAVRGVGTGDGTSLEPLRLLPLPSHLVRGAIEQGRIVSLQPAAGGPSHPLGPAFDTAATCLNSAELAAILNLPRREIPGLPMREHAEFGLCVPPPDGVGIEIGALLDGAGRRLEPVTVPLGALNRHVFITGMTGFGKTTTCKRLLLEAYGRHGLPFLVVEPAKAEYRELANMRALRGKLRVYAMGADSPLPFRLNPLQPVPGAPLARHIDLLKAVFNASFPMFAGMTYILEEALYEVYRERGWSLYTSGNALLRERSSAEDIAALTPTLEDLHAKIDVVLGEKKYGKEVEQNLGAALRSRLKSLLVGNKGIMLNTRRSTPLEDLFRSPAVIELQNLGDDEEKGFVMALLFVLLYEYAEVRQRDFPAETRGNLQHLTLIEEAHRLLQAGGARASSETADPRGKAVAMFTDMLAEMRAYGEGFIIADQSPTKLVNAVLKNSALKIIHRLTYPDDRQAAGACVNLDHSQIQFLNDLPVGLAVVHDERIGRAVLARIHPLASESEIGGRTIDAIAGMDRRDRRLLHRHGGCEACLSPCDFFHRLDEFRSGEHQSRNQRRFFDSLLIGEPEEAWVHWQAWRAQLPAERGLAYCIGAMAAFDWLGRVLSARNLLFNPGANFLAPEDHLRRDKAARSAARLMSAWEGARDLAADARLAFLNTQEELRRLVASAPPLEQPGCARCPARCDMLPFAGPSVRSLEKSLNGKLLGERGMTPAQHLQSIQDWLAGDAGLDLDARGLQSHLREWTYCLMTNSSLPPPTSTRRDKLLLELLQPASGPQ